MYQTVIRTTTEIRDYLLMYYTSTLVNCLLAKPVPQTHILIHYIELKGKSASSLQLLKLRKYRKPTHSISSVHNTKGMDVHFPHKVLSMLQN